MSGRITKKQGLRFLREWGLMLVILLIILVATIVKPQFLSGSSFLNILRSVSTLGVAAVGLTFIIVGGSSDLSVGSTVSLAGVLGMMIMNSPLGVNPATSNFAAILAILAGMAAGACVGLLNGSAMTFINGKSGESYVLTYSTSVVVSALALIINGTFQYGQYPDKMFKNMGMGIWPIVMLLIVAAIGHVVLSKTTFGREIYFKGANPAAAKMAGIRTGRITIACYMIGGMCAGLAGILLISRVASASASQGAGYELNALSVVALGGTPLSGGRGSVAKTILGVVVMGVLISALNVLSITTSAQLIVKGVVVIASVILDGFNQRAVEREAVA